MKYEIESLKQLVNERLLVWNKHPELSINIFNYTQRCQYSQSWNELTKKCRGLVLDDTGNVVAKGFDKFFNYNEPGVLIPKDSPRIYEKMDGSLILVTYYKNTLVVSTRGSFVSEQAILAKTLIEKNTELLEYIKEDNNKHTFLFELIGPANRIVVIYPHNEIIFLGAIENSTEKDIIPENINMPIIVKKVEQISTGSENYIEYLQSMKVDNKEGFVLVWENMGIVSYRLKFKFDSYIELHKIIYGLNKKDIIDYIMNKNIEELYIKLPEEFYVKIKQFIDEANNEYKLIEQMCMDHLATFNSNATRKEIAISTINNFRPYSSIIFNMLDKKEYSKGIWELIKESFNDDIYL